MARLEADLDLHCFQKRINLGSAGQGLNMCFKRTISLLNPHNICFG